MRTRNGRPITVEDAQIASIALVGGLWLATRNEIKFADISGLVVINPWAMGEGDKELYSICVEAKTLIP